MITVLLLASHATRLVYVMTSLSLLTRLPTRLPTSYKPLRLAHREGAVSSRAVLSRITPQ